MIYLKVAMVFAILVSVGGIIALFWVLITALRSVEEELRYELPKMQDENAP